MKVTFSHLFTRAVTLQYPDERWTMPERNRSKLWVKIEDCIGCRQCERACPVNCIIIETIKARPGEHLGLTENKQMKKNFLFPKFDIDMSECCYCGLCTFPCPTECIYWTADYEFSEYDRANFIYHFGNLSRKEARERRREIEKLKEAKVQPPPKT